jgi:hypothetical protein
MGTKAKTIYTEELEDVALASLIEKGMKTGNVNRTSVMKVLSR